MSEEFDKRLPLSPAQRGIWFADQVDAAQRNYNIGARVDISGRIDTATLQTAVRMAIEETDALRLRFVDEDDGPWQYVETSARSELSVVDLSSSPEPRTAADHWIQRDLMRPVPIVGAELSRWALLKTGPDESTLYLRFHHIAIDGYSVFLVARRVADIYTGTLDGTAREFPPADSFEQILHDELSYSTRKSCQRDKKYWSGRLAGAAPLTLAGTAAPASETFLRTTTYVSSAQTKALREVAENLGSSPAGIVLAATALYLNRTAVDGESRLGLVVSRRMNPMALRVPCMMADILPLVLAPRPSQSLRDILRETSRETSQVLRHQRYRSEDLKRDLDLVGTGDRLFGPVVNVMEYDGRLNFGECQASIDGLLAWPVDDFAINVYSNQASSQIRIDFDANPAVYTETDLANHQRRLLAMLDTLVMSDPGQPVASIDLLDERERHQVLVEWNATTRPVP
ncbi:condensation domain-containing protein, partial [Rugosimonospora africana]|uniref:condensation domain-containing protein n=1 Tax=Rugosimonospora africana TaxID=556532 RepID=UPI001EF1A851